MSTGMAAIARADWCRFHKLAPLSLQKPRNSMNPSTDTSSSHRLSSQHRGGALLADSLPARPATSSYKVTMTEGEALAGSLGVRGLIMTVASTQNEATPRIISLALDSLRRDGVKRAHIFVETEGENKDAALRAGFEAREGESLYKLTLKDRPTTPRMDIAPYTLRDGTVEDLVRLGLRLADIPELAFESWELPLLFANIEKHDRFFKIVELNGQIVGVSVGGSSDTRGSISHTWVAKEHRHHGLGHALSDSSLLALYDGGARDIHLMTVAGNTKANHFWELQGFVRATDVQFLEIDL